ncbi:nucleoside hydrolase [Patella vulgata]|uniref:nucleoside hydrolase n=1 Tax=Patella vulgata TaxID=6465 RepID=UPI0021802814|nr:nucleoside hydrolase [Patella vulgata]
MLKMKVILDVDPGDDDAQALMFILNNPAIEIIGITCVRGNVELDKVCVNILRILKVCGRLDIPVYRGADQFLMGGTTDAAGFHGNDGLGDVDWSDEVDMELIQPEHAVNALTRMARKHSGDVSLITLGPLTNIALAIRMDSSFGEQFKAVYMMGGNFEGKGNTIQAAEFNFYVDPEAADIVLLNMSCKIYIVPLETCVRSILPWDFYEKWTNIATPKGTFNKKISRNSANRMLAEVTLRTPGYRSCDLFAMIAFIHSDVVLESAEASASIELKGELTRGQMVVDWDNRWSSRLNVVIYQTLDVEKIKHHMMNMFN